MDCVRRVRAVGGGTAYLYLQPTKISKGSTAMRNILGLVVVLLFAGGLAACDTTVGTDTTYYFPQANAYGP